MEEVPQTVMDLAEEEAQRQEQVGEGDADEAPTRVSPEPESRRVMGTDYRSPKVLQRTCESWRVTLLVFWSGDLLLTT